MPLFTAPMYSSISLGLFPAAVMRVGEATSFGGMGRKTVWFTISIKWESLDFDNENDRDNDNDSLRKPLRITANPEGRNPDFLACRFALRRGRRRTV